LPFIDCHVHTIDFSCDASATLEALVARGHLLGLEAFSTTEHVDFDPRDGCYGHYDYARHQLQRARLRAHPADGLMVLTGAEVDYQKQFDAEVRQFMDAAKYDFCIGSVHYARGEAIFWPSFYQAPERENYEAYFEEVLSAVQSGLFDVLGHLDIVKRYGVQHYGPFDSARYADEIDTILRACVDTGTGLEINTSGLRGPPREVFPALSVLKRYRALGGQVLTVGSDAHVVADLARDIPLALDLAKTAGFEAVTLFVERQPTWLPLD
jgi:histidinol-phosphatase (PHP family)